MKKLLSILLALVMVAMLITPVIATDEAYDVQITSVIEVDAAYRDRGDAPVYWWISNGKFNATVAGKALTNITLEELSRAIEAAYGIYVNYSTNFSDQYSDPWTVGQTYPATIAFSFWDETSEQDVVLFTLNAQAKAVETKIASVSVEPVTMYVGQTYKTLRPVITYKDGTTEALQESCQYEWEFPTAVGTYHYTVSVSAFQDVPVTITVLPVPTSGKCGENINWTYDATTKTLSLTGTGAMYQIAKSIDAYWNEDYDFEPAFWYCDAEHIVVGEGITQLPDFAFFGMQNKTLQLPTTLKALPTYGLLTSTLVETLTIPEGITEISGWPFGSPGNSFLSLKELKLPSTLKKIDELTLLLSGLNNRNASVTLEKIEFAGTEEQWKALERIDSESIKVMMGDDYENFKENWVEPAKKLLANVPVVYAPPKVTVDSGVASVPDSIVKVESGKDTVIDVTTTTEKADTVEIKPETVDKLAGNQAAVEIKLPEATVSFDKTAISAINTQAGTASVTLVAKEVEKATLKAPQIQALEKTTVHQYLSLEAKAGQTQITEFGGGTVTVSVPFALPAGKTGADMVVAHVADNGKLTTMPTTYKDGYIQFTTTHFSSYVVVEKASLPTENPKTGDTILLAMPLMLLSITGMAALYVAKRRYF